MTNFPLAALSDSRTLFEIGLIIVLAAAAPLIAQVLRVPSILLLLALGFGAGAIGALDPNALLGEAVVSATVPLRDRGRRWTRPYRLPMRGPAKAPMITRSVGATVPGRSVSLR